MVFFGSNPAGAPVIGWIAETWGARWSIGVGAIAAILVATITSVWVKRHWGVEVTYSLQNRPHVILTHPEERAAREQAQLEVAAQQSTDRGV